MLRRICHFRLDFPPRKLRCCKQKYLLLDHWIPHFVPIHQFNNEIVVKEPQSCDLQTLLLLVYQEFSHSLLEKSKYKQLSIYMILLPAVGTVFIS